MNTPAGYTLYITTWENDADVYKTKELQGLTEGEVRYYIDLAQQFYSKNGWEKTGARLGNYGHSTELLSTVVTDVMYRHQDVIKDLTVANEDSVHDYLCDTILSWTENYCDEENFCRVFESFKVVRVFESFKVVKIPTELVDVTEQFKIEE